MDRIRGPCSPAFQRPRPGSRVTYRFEGSSFSTDLAVGGNAGPARTVDLDDDAYGLRWAELCRLSELQELAVLNPNAQGSAALMSGRPQRRSIRPGSPQTPIRRRWAQVSGRRDGTTKPAKDAADESAPKISALEAELLGLRQLLAKIRAKSEDLRQEMDDLRRDRDHWQNLAKSAGVEKVETRAWFCGRASSGA